MEKLKIICAFLGILTVQNVSAQIVVGGNETKADEPKVVQEKPREKKVFTKTGNNALVFHFNRSNSFRILKENEGLFADSLGYRANETQIKVNSFGLGYRTNLAKSLNFGLGLYFMQNGEGYTMPERPDTAFSYISVYRHTAMPLYLEYTYGKDIQFVGIAGVMPAMFFNSNQKIMTTDSLNAEKTVNVKTKNGSSDFNSVTFSAFIGVGVNFRYADSWCFYIRPEYRFQLNSTYSKTSPYIHKATAFGLSFGLNYILD